MAKLIIKQKSEVISELELASSKNIYAIGSDKNNDLILPDPHIGPEHLQIERIHDSYHMADLGSEFGTVLNGRPVKKLVQLVDGDEIIVGEYTILFTSQSFGLHPAPYNPPDMLTEVTAARNLFSDYTDNRFDGINTETHTHTIDTAGTATAIANYVEFETDSDLPGASKAEKHPGQLKEMHCPFFLLAIYGPYTGTKYPLNARDTKIGRDIHLNDIVIRRNNLGQIDSSISRRHATISYQNERLAIKDKRSKTRTFVNRTEVTATKSVAVDLNDEIEIVSDQVSTIFRVLKKHDFDLSPPCKAGTWWMRNKFKAGILLSAMLGIILVFLIAATLHTSRLNNMQPDPLTITGESWHTPTKSIASTPGRKLTPPAVPSTQLAIADVDGNGSVDVISSDAGHSLYALDGPSKSELWRYQWYKVNPDVAITLEDINTNGLSDILFAGQDSRIHAIDGQNGADIWSSPILNAIAAPPAVGNINGDDIPDAAIVTRSGTVLIGYGTKSEPDWHALQTGKVISAAPALADLSNNGYCDIFVSTQDGKLLILDGLTRKIIMDLDINSPDRKTSDTLISRTLLLTPPAFGDLNNDNIADIVITTSVGRHHAICGRTYDRIWHYDLPKDHTGLSEHFAPAIGLFNNDEFADVALFSEKQVRIIAGSEHQPGSKDHLWLYNTDNGLELTSNIAVADFNKDQLHDIVLASKTGEIFILDGKTGKELKRIRVAGTMTVNSPVVIADIDGTGYLSILYSSSDNIINRIQTSSSTPKNSIVCAQVFHDAQHSNHFPLNSPQTVLLNILLIIIGGLFLVMAFSTYYSYRTRNLLILSNQKAAI